MKILVKEIFCFDKDFSERVEPCGFPSHGTCWNGRAMGPTDPIDPEPSDDPEPMDAKQRLVELERL